MQPQKPTRSELTRLINQAHAYQRAGQPGRALSIFQSIRPYIAKEPGALRLHAILLSVVGEYEKAIEIIDRALKQRPMDPLLRVDRARILTEMGRFEDALLETERSLAGNKRFTQAAHAKVVALRRLGRRGEAHEWLMSRAEDLPCDSWLADAMAEVAGEAEDRSTIIATIRRVLEGELADEERMPLLFKLGTILDQTGQHDEAFEAFECANRMGFTGFDSAAHTEETQKLIASWQGELSPVAANSSYRPVFILGMPRSGTSLVEQVLSAHPEIGSAGETTVVAQAIRELGCASPKFGYVHSLERCPSGGLEREGEALIERLAHEAGGRADQVLTEKLPHNIFHIGLLATLFPEARFIHCVRDLRDTCLSCYFTSFAGHLPFTNDLVACAHYAADVRLQGAFWEEKLPARMMRVGYRDLVSDLETEVRSILEFVGVPFEEACLHYHESGRTVRTASFEQATKPIYTSSLDRWRPYEQHLEPLMNVLRERGIQPEG